MDGTITQTRLILRSLKPHLQSHSSSKILKENNKKFTCPNLIIQQNSKSLSQLYYPVHCRQPWLHLRGSHDRFSSLVF